MSSEKIPPVWALSVGGVVLLAATGAIGTYVGTTLAAHGETISQHGRTDADHEARISGLERVTGRMDDKLDKILDELRKP